MAKRKSIEELVYAALRDTGQLLPTTVEDVRQAEKWLEANPVVVPESLRDPMAILEILERRPMPEVLKLRCAMCGEFIPPDPEWSDADARVEAESKGIDPDESDVVCDDCYKKTPWGVPNEPTEAPPDA